jgi:hypothetical protein
VTERRSPYLVSPLYDWLFFLSPPVVALALGIAISGSRFASAVVGVGEDATLAGLVLGVLIHAHLAAVLFRSHANPRVRRRHPVRFLLVPSALWAALMWSPWIAAAATVVATFWDVWHSGAQTFGFARIYDRNAGAAVDRDRLLELGVSQVLYAGPILAGATLFDHLDVLSEMEGFDDPLALFLTSVPAHAAGHRGAIAWAVIALGTALVAAYVLVHVRRARRGVPVSAPKVWLVGSTGLCSLYTWGLNSWGEAFFVMNLFHAVQYLALVWWSERDTLARALRVAGTSFARPVSLAVFLGSTLAYGLFAELLDPGVHALWSLTMVVSLMHFWYDGFVWSVRRSDV